MAAAAASEYPAAGRHIARAAEPRASGHAWLGGRPRAGAHGPCPARDPGGIEPRDRLCGGRRPNRSCARAGAVRAEGAPHGCARSGTADAGADLSRRAADRSEEHTSELQSLMRISYAVFCLKKKKVQITK